VKKPFNIKQLFTRSALLATAASMLVLPLSASVFAANEGVYIQDSVYFSLNNVTLASGADTGSLRFTLELHNGSGQSIDFNRYGVKIIDSSGVSYTAKLSEKVSARVKPQQVQDYKFISQVPADAQADGLKVDLFEWSSQAPYTQEIGALSVASAIQVGNPGAKQVVLNLSGVDATYPDDALAAFELGQSYRVLKDGVWNIYTDFYVENLGSSSFKLPAGLSYNYKDKSGLTYAALVVNGDGTTLLPNQRVKFTMQAAISNKIDAEQLALQFLKKTTTSVKEVITSVDLKSSLLVNKPGAAAAYPYADLQGVNLTTSWATVSKQSDGLHVQANVTLTNKGTDIATVPVLTGEFQAINSNIGIISNDNAVRPAYLSPNESVTYKYSGVLASGLNIADLQLAVLEKKSATAGSSSQDPTAPSSVPQSVSLPVLITTLSDVGSSQQDNPYGSAQNYKLGTPFGLSTNSFIDSNIDVSLMELHMQANEDLGYKTVIAKYKLTNKGTASLTLPNFQADLINNLGYTYTGVRQTQATQTILPNTSNVVSYSFLIPSGETADQLAMNLYDDTRTSIGSFKVEMQNEATDGPISFYPFQVDVKDYNVSASYSNSSYTYKLTMDMDVNRQEEVIVDPNFSKLTFDLSDALGHVLATQTLSFTGSQKLVSGKQTVAFSSVKIDQIENGITIRMYEQIDTPNGVTKRLVKVLNN
jgi:hypothetical protein